MYVGSGTPNNTLLNLSGYAQIEKKVWEVINLSVGGRLEYFQLNDTETAIKPVFRAGGNIKLHQETYLRMSYGQGYRFPTITERFIQTGVGNFGVFANPNLQAETSTNGEVGIKQGVKIRSEERRVGKECRARRWRYEYREYKEGREKKRRRVE